VIAAFFQENGLVSQQINSFDFFLSNGIQDTVEEVGRITIKPEKQYRPGESKRTSGIFPKKF
jgi:DNA-directed RNA polymerase beta subunit